VSTAYLSPRPTRPVAACPAVGSLVAVLRQLADLLAVLTDEQYRMSPVGVVSSSIGAHVRHCLDHVDALLCGVAAGRITYDQRLRGGDVETSRSAALSALRRQEWQLSARLAGCEDQSMRLSAVVSPGLPAVEADTSVGRELVFVLSHTIHHNALIGVIARILGVPLPKWFGYAPSTVAHLEESRCAR
jgi:uncharacterized damage-inducible protein DinB